MMASVHAFPALPAPSVIVHTGGAMDSRSYNAVNSQKVLQGDGSNLTDSSINIGQSFNERQERITALDDLNGKLKSAEAKSDATEKAEKALSKVRAGAELGNDQEVAGGSKEYNWRCWSEL
jgi:hypothetical protein